jgi:hypothetical protein
LRRLENSAYISAYFPSVSAARLRRQALEGLYIYNRKQILLDKAYLLFPHSLRDDITYKLENLIKWKLKYDYYLSDRDVLRYVRDELNDWLPSPKKIKTRKKATKKKTKKKATKKKTKKKATTKKTKKKTAKKTKKKTAKKTKKKTAKKTKKTAKK